MKYAGVIVDISHENVDKEFQYIIPESLEAEVDIGVRVKVPFRTSERSGYVVEISDIPQYDPDRIKPITCLDDKGLPIDERMVRLAYWMKQNYGSTINQALKTVLPVKDKIKEERQKTVSLLVSKQEALTLSAECLRKHAGAQARLLAALAENEISEYSLISDKLNISASTFSALEKKQIIRIESIVAFRNAIDVKAKNASHITLNEEQHIIANRIIGEMDAGDLTPFLIKGVTGSGKTEVYMELIEHTLQAGKEVIVLIPEISLTYQNVMRFYTRFGNIVSVINSRLSKGEKYDRFRLARSGEIRIMIGPRSALFTPFTNLGLIIIDEEHENAYQSETIPKYHARETAIELAKMCQAKVVMGSATPSLEAYYRAQTGIYHLGEMRQRAGNAALPQVDIVDMREELKKGNRSIFSNQLMQLIEDRLNKKEQIMLFLNRRGYQSFISCRDCGEVIECPHCAVSLTQHYNNKLYCHYCGYETSFVRLCPKCGSKHIGTFKAGTEKVEEDAKKLFPDAKILRMDLDTTKGKDGHQKILEQFADCNADILIGTQMIVKGHDFPRVTLMGILVADMSLHVSDYRAGEQTFDLLTQAAGRAGRGDIAGNVIIQTYDPENYSIVCAQNHDYEAFYEEEISYRELLAYPPVCHMMTVKLSSSDEPLLSRVATYFAKAGDVHSDTQIIGPANAGVYKINDVFYKLIFFKNVNYSALTEIKDFLEGQMQKYHNEMKDIHIQFEFG